MLQVGDTIPDVAVWHGPNEPEPIADIVEVVREIAELTEVAAVPTTA